MGEDFYRVLIKKIINNIPDNKKPVNYLMDILNIGRESTYRRLRGNIPFTFDEIIKLSLSLDFSIDEIIGRGNGSNAFFYNLQQKKPSDYNELFYITHLDFYNILVSASNAKDTEILFSINHITSFFALHFNCLFKFYYYIWMHQCGGISSNCSFSEIELPSNIASIQQKIKSTITLIPNITCIFDQYLIMRLARTLQYYYSRNLFSHEELEVIKSEVIGFIDYIEKFLQIRANGTGMTYNFYLSLLEIDMNSMYGTYDNSTISHYWTCNVNSVNTGNSDLIALHKNWMHSLKRSSILISQSNEIVQASFLNLQRENIERVTKDTFLYYG